MNQEISDYVAANIDRSNRSIATPKNKGPQPIAQSPSQLLEDYEIAVRDWNIKLIQTTIENYDETFKAEISKGIKPSAIDRIYKWCVANGQDPDWSLMGTPALKALATTITRAVEAEVMALPGVKELLEECLEFQYQEDDDSEDF